MTTSSHSIYQILPVVASVVNAYRNAIDDYKKDPENYDYKYYIARADIRNNPSIKLMKKLNMIYVLTEERVYPDGRPISEEVEYRLDINKGE